MLDAPRPAGHLLWRVNTGREGCRGAAAPDSRRPRVLRRLGRSNVVRAAVPACDAAGEAIALESSGTLNNLLGHGWTLAVEPETPPSA